MPNNNQPVPAPSLRVAYAENFQSLYSNSVQTRVTPWDVRMEFGELGIATGQELVVQQKVAVTMSPTHAKAFMEVLQRELHNYEEQFGTIWTAQQNSQDVQR